MALSGSPGSAGQAPATGTPLRIRLLGGLELSLAGRPLAPPATQKAQSLLAYLLTFPTTQTRERLSDLFWPESPEELARRSLRTALWRVRRALTDVPGPELIVATDQVIRVNPDAHYELDTRELEDATAVGADAGALRRATALYRGDFLDGFYDDWCVAKREYFRERYLGALATLARLLLERGELAEAQKYAQTLVAQDPLREDGHRLLMEAHDRAGNRAAALRQFEQVRQILRDEVGVEPAPETRALLEQIRGRGPAPPTAASRPHPPVRRPPRSRLVGRDEELSLLDRAWQRAARGSGTTVFVGGEAGIGKTTLVNELARSVRAQGGRALTGHCYEFERLLPYQPIIEVLRTAAGDLSGLSPTWGSQIGRLVPELAERFPKPSTLADEQALPRLFESVLQAIRHLTRSTPLLISLEDLHWATESTLQLVHYVVARSAKLPVLLVATHRTEALQANEPLVQLLRASGRGGAARSITLQRLTTDQTRELVAGLWPEAATVPDLLVRLQQTTEGNPFFLIESVRSVRESPERRLEGTLPPRIRDAVLARTQGLGEAERRALRAAAVLGREFDLLTLRTALDWDEETALEATERLLARGLIEDSPSPIGRDFQFGHQLTREVIYQDLSRHRRQYYHRRALQALAGLPEASPGVTAELVHHALAVEDWANAIEYLDRAARRAREQHALSEAVDYLSQAIEVAARPEAGAEPDRLYHFHSQRGQALARIGRIGQALADRQRALELARGLGNRAAEIRDLLAIGFLQSGARGLGLPPTYREALDLARAVGDRPGEIDSLNRIGNWELNAGHLTAAAGHHQEALALAQALGDTGRVADALDGIGLVHWFRLAIPDAIAAYREVLELRRVLDDTAGTIWPLSQIGSALAAQGRYAEALETSLESLRVCRAIGDRTTEPAVLYQLGLTTQFGGAYDYLTAFEAGLALAQEVDHHVWIAIGTPLAALARLTWGETVPPFSAADLTKWLEHTSGSPLWQALVTTFAGQVRRAQGDAAGAIELLASAAVESEALGAYFVALIAWPDLGLAQVAAGDPVGALATADRIAAACDQTGADHFRITAAWIVGRAADRSGDPEAAAASLREALRLAEAYQAWPTLWACAADLARLLVRLDREAEASRVFDLAAQTVTRLAERLPDDRRAGFLARPDVQAVLARRTG
ncbi:MAG TPA: AAA family ATPase [Dehalococcoidia bacterium]|nr:AAA family ATPase [Dehalococcoidia bacterium]